MFANSHSFRIDGGQFNIAGHNSDPLRDLWDAIKDVGASHNSEMRYPPPKCHPNTRQKVLRMIHKWVYSTSWWDGILWLYGPAGAGKSAIAQTIAETGQREGFLLSSFFFSRGDPKHNNPKSLFLTISHALAASIPELQPLIEQALRSNPTILQASLEEQYEKLIAEPCGLLAELLCFPWLIVIDGLDECDGSREQQRILSILGTLIQKIRLRILICSRPEPPIHEILNIDALCPYLHHIVLDDTFSPGHDISTFLIKEFQRIHAKHAFQHIPFPVPWPAPGVVGELVQKASGQFIYAATVIKFIDNEYCNPCAQLETILHPEPQLDLDPESRSPFHDLDTLYHQILSSCPQHSKLQNVIWVIVLPPTIYGLDTTPENIEALLMLHDGEVISTLWGMHSILKIGQHDQEICILHASFGDKCAQHSLLATQLLHVIDHYSQIDEDSLSDAQSTVLDYAWFQWEYHCSESNFNASVLEALQSVNFTGKLGRHIANYLHNNQKNHEEVQQFFHANKELWDHLEIESNMPADIKHYISNAWCLSFSVHSDIPDEVASQVLEATAFKLGLVYFDDTEEDVLFEELSIPPETLTKMSDFFHQKHF
ncbi:nwd2 [Moniliophthora roreri]|uniref:Nephrocystin 3-like N-terminal domain-containing protein n=1 Tax=Moniliophthora roreri TaxID=221103 RepID=A0A0W0G5D6_MONRR|nr:nwd2 [Moniliophthora roreri]